MPVLKKKNRTDNARRTTMPNFPDNPEIPEMSAMRVKDIPYDNTPAGVDKKPDMDMPRSMLLHDMAKVAHKKPFKDELKQRYHIYKDISDTLIRKLTRSATSCQYVAIVVGRTPTG